MALLTVLPAVGCGSERTPSSPEEVVRSPVVVAAGDIDANCRREDGEAPAELTAKLVIDIQGTVLALGDLALPSGSAENFENCYDLSWGYFKHRTRPVPGNKEYYTQGAAGYFDYFGEKAGEPGKGYYSFDLDNWHLVALNSNCDEIDGCYEEAPQLRWLKEDLAANDDKACTLAYFHHPLFTSGRYHPGYPRVKLLWETLYAAGVDVVLNGHERTYERFAPQNPEGRADPERGIREFVVGTGGGKGRYPILEPIANSEVRNDETYGVLKLTLHPKSYEWRFVPVEGETFSDSGSARCH